VADRNSRAADDKNAAYWRALAGHTGIVALRTKALLDEPHWARPR
jgi:hypothetical protein